MSRLLPTLTIACCVVSPPAFVLFDLVWGAAFSISSTLLSLELADIVILVLSTNSCSSTNILVDLLDISLLISVKLVIFLSKTPSRGCDRSDTLVVFAAGIATGRTPFQGRNLLGWNLLKEAAGNALHIGLV